MISSRKGVCAPAFTWLAQVAARFEAHKGIWSTQTQTQKYKEHTNTGKQKHRYKEHTNTGTQVQGAHK